MAEASLAACRDLSKFGIAIAAIIPMIATTISSSISENPLSLFIQSSSFLVSFSHCRRKVSLAANLRQIAACIIATLVPLGFGKALTSELLVCKGNQKKCEKKRPVLVGIFNKKR